MGFGEFWLHSKNGKKIDLNFQGQVRRSDFAANEKLLAIFNFFDKDGNGVIESNGVNGNEIVNIFNYLKATAEIREGKNSGDTIIDTLEAFSLTQNVQQLKNLSSKDIFDFLNIFEDKKSVVQNSQVYTSSDGTKTVVNHFSTGEQETVIYDAEGNVRIKYKETTLTEDYTQMEKVEEKDGVEKYRQNVNNGQKRATLTLPKGIKECPISLSADSIAYFKDKYGVDVGAAYYKDGIMSLHDKDGKPIAHIQYEIAPEIKQELRKFVGEHLNNLEYVIELLNDVGWIDRIGINLQDIGFNLTNGLEVNGLEVLKQYLEEAIENAKTGKYLAIMSDGDDDSYGVSHFNGKYAEVTGKDNLDFLAAEKLRITSMKYNDVKSLYQRAEILKNGLSEVQRRYKNAQTAKSGIPGSGNLNTDYAGKLVEVLKGFLYDNEELTRAFISSISQDIGSKDDLEANLPEILKRIEDSVQKSLEKTLGGETLEEIETRYQKEYKAVYGKEDVVPKIEEMVMDGKEVGGFVQLGMMTAATIILGAFTCGTGSVALDTFIGYLETIGTDYALSLSNALTSQKGLTKESHQAVLERTAGTAEFVGFGMVAANPLARAAGKFVSKVFAPSTSKLLDGAFVKGAVKGAVRKTTGSVTQTTLSAEQMLQFMMVKSSEFFTEVTAFTGFELINQDEDFLKAFGGQTSMLGKLKVMNSAIQVLLGSFLKNRIIAKNAKQAVKQYNQMLKDAGLKDAKIIENKSPSGAKYTLEMEGKTYNFNSIEELGTNLTLIMAVSYASAKEVPADVKSKSTDELRAEYERLLAKEELTQEDSEAIIDIFNELTSRGEIDEEGNLVEIDEGIEKEVNPGDNPASVASNRITQQWILDGIEQSSPEMVLKSKSNSSAKEVSQLIFSGELTGHMTQRYDALTDALNNFAKNHSAAIYKLYESCNGDTKLFATEFLKMLSKEYGDSDYIPQIEVFEGEALADGFYNFIRNTINISANNNISDLCNVLVHEYTHALQYLEVFNKYGEQGIRDIINKNPNLTDEEKAILIEKTLKSKSYQYLLSRENTNKPLPGSVDDYLASVYKEEFSNPVDGLKNRDAYLARLVELEAYFVENNNDIGKAISFAEQIFGRLGKMKSAEDIINQTNFKTISQEEFDKFINQPEFVEFNLNFKIPMTTTMFMKVMNLMQKYMPKTYELVVNKNTQKENNSKTENDDNISRNMGLQHIRENNSKSNILRDIDSYIEGYKQYGEDYVPKGLSNNSVFMEFFRHKQVECAAKPEEIRGNHKIKARPARDKIFDRTKGESPESCIQMLTDLIDFILTKSQYATKEDYYQVVDKLAKQMPEYVRTKYPNIRPEIAENADKIFRWQAYCKGQFPGEQKADGSYEVKTNKFFNEEKQQQAVQEYTEFLEQMTGKKVLVGGTEVFGTFADMVGVFNNPETYANVDYIILGHGTGNSKITDTSSPDTWMFKYNGKSVWEYIEENVPEGKNALVVVCEHDGLTPAQRKSQPDMVDKNGAPMKGIGEAANGDKNSPLKICTSGIRHITGQTSSVQSGLARPFVTSQVIYENKTIMYDLDFDKYKVKSDDSAFNLQHLKDVSESEATASKTVDISNIRRFGDVFRKLFIGNDICKEILKDSGFSDEEIASLREQYSNKINILATAIRELKNVGELSSKDEIMEYIENVASDSDYLAICPYFNDKNIEWLMNAGNMDRTEALETLTKIYGEKTLDINTFKDAVIRAQKDHISLQDAIIKNRQEDAILLESVINKDYNQEIADEILNFKSTSEELDCEYDNILGGLDADGFKMMKIIMDASKKGDNEFIQNIHNIRMIVDDLQQYFSVDEIEQIINMKNSDGKPVINRKSYDKLARNKFNDINLPMTPEKINNIKNSIKERFENIIDNDLDLIASQIKDSKSASIMSRLLTAKNNEDGKFLYDLDMIEASAKYLNKFPDNAYLIEMIHNKTQVISDNKFFNIAYCEMVKMLENCTSDGDFIINELLKPSSEDIHWRLIGFACHSINNCGNFKLAQNVAADLLTRYWENQYNAGVLAKFTNEKAILLIQKMVNLQEADKSQTYSNTDITRLMAKYELCDDKDVAENLIETIIDNKLHINTFNLLMNYKNYDINNGTHYTQFLIGLLKIQDENNVHKFSACGMQTIIDNLPKPVSEKALNYITNVIKENPTLTTKQIIDIAKGYSVEVTNTPDYPFGADGIFAKEYNRIIMTDAYKKLPQDIKTGLFDYFTDLVKQDPNRFKRLVDSGYFELCSEGKLNIEDLVANIGTRKFFSKNFLNDVKRMSSGEPLVKEYVAGTPLSKLAKEVDIGEVASVNGKLYVNDNGNMVELKISKEKFEELFPLESRFNSKQGNLGDCWLVSALDELMDIPNGRAKLYQLFEQNGNDITVTIPNKENIQVSKQMADGSYEISWKEQFTEPYRITFKNGNPVKSRQGQQISGCKGFQLIEQAYSYNRSINADKEITIDEMEVLFDVEAQMHHLKGGHSREFISSILEYRVDGQNIIDKNNELVGQISEPQNNIKAAIQLIKSVANSDNILLYASTLHKADNASRLEKDLAPSYDLFSNHAYSIKGFDEKLGHVYFTNPWNTNSIVEMDVYTFLDYIDCITYLKVN